MEDLWIVLYDTQTGNVWGEVVTSDRWSAQLLALWLTRAAGGSHRFRAAVVPHWMEVPPEAVVVASDFPVFTQWTEGPWPEVDAAQALLVASDNGETPDDSFISEWLELFSKYEDKIEKLRERAERCGLKERELRPLAVECITETFDRAMSSGIEQYTSDPSRFVDLLLECWSKKLDEAGCKDREIPTWAIATAAGVGVVLVGGGIWYVARRAK